MRHSVAHFMIKVESHSSELLIDDIVFFNSDKGEGYEVARFKATELLPFLRYYSSWLLRNLKMRAQYIQSSDTGGWHCISLDQVANVKLANCNVASLANLNRNCKNSVLINRKCCNQSCYSFRESRIPETINAPTGVFAEPTLLSPCRISVLHLTWLSVAVVKL